jgi:hypothetical protein
LFLPFRTQSFMNSFLSKFYKSLFLSLLSLGTSNLVDAKPAYEWTTDHMHVGVRWQPSVSRPLNNAYELTRPILAEHSSYVMFWVAWPQIEPNIQNCDYQKHPSGGLKMFDEVVSAANRDGLFVEFVFFGFPGWAAEVAPNGDKRPKPDHFSGFMERLATHFKGRVHSWQLGHETNLKSILPGADVEFLHNEIFIKGAKAVRGVYDQEPALPVLISTSGTSPCEGCPVIGGLDGRGGRAVNDYLEQKVKNKTLMELVDCLNINVSDHHDGYGMMDGSFVTSTWGNYDLLRQKMDREGYGWKPIVSAEAWVNWDDGNLGTMILSADVNGDGVRNEIDGFYKTLTLMGQCMERGMNVMNFLWTDNESPWSMGLTKRRDYNGRVGELRPDLVIPASDGGPAVITRKVSLRGGDHSFIVADGQGEIFTIEDYQVPSDPNHLMYYVWQWFAQAGGGRDEVIRHALAGEVGNDLIVSGQGYTGNERYRVSTWNRTQKRFTNLIYSSGGSGTTPAEIRIPATVQSGKRFNHAKSCKSFQGEGFRDGSFYKVDITTKNINPATGEDEDVELMELGPYRVRDGILTAKIPRLNKFTKVDFIPSKMGKGRR